jgi:hypothetical protein
MQNQDVDYKLNKYKGRKSDREDLGFKKYLMGA